MPNALSLFSGAGGDTKGLELAGWKVTHYSEVNEHAIATHQAAFPHSVLLTGTNGSKDITQIPDETFAALRGRIDLIVAGFPCQGFSHGGKKRQDDPRNELVHQFVRATRLIQPEWIIGENVKGLLSRRAVYPKNSTVARPVIEIISDLFNEIGYKIAYKVIDATEVGVPQLRKRLIIIGHRGPQYLNVPWAKEIKYRHIPVIRALLKDTLRGAMEMPALYKCHEQPSRFWIQTTATKPSPLTPKPHPNLVRLVNGIRNKSSKEKEEAGEDPKAKIPVTEPEGLISFGVRKGGYHGQILDPDAPCKTIICTYNLCPRLFVGLHNPKTKKYWIRCLTVQECGQIQGFPEDYPWQGAEKDQLVQIGNAIPPPLARAVVNLLPSIIFSDTPIELPPEPEEEDDATTDSDD